MLWVGLGNALVDHAGDHDPGRRAGLLAPRPPSWRRESPGPPFFHGLALLRSGDREGALKEWQAVLAAAPAEAEWRPFVEDGVAMIERGQAGS